MNSNRIRLWNLEWFCIDFLVYQWGYSILLIFKILILVFLRNGLWIHMRDQIFLRLSALRSLHRQIIPRLKPIRISQHIYNAHFPFRHEIRHQLHRPFMHRLIHQILGSWHNYISWRIQWNVLILKNRWISTFHTSKIWPAVITRPPWFL